MDREQVQRIRDDAAEDLARPQPSTRGRQHARMLTDPRDRTIVALADALLDDGNRVAVGNMAYVTVPEAAEQLGVGPRDVLLAAHAANLPLTLSATRRRLVIPVVALGRFQAQLEATL